MHFSTCFISPLETKPPFLRANFLEAAFFPKLCLLLIRLNLIFPVAVNENRLAAAFLVFNFIFLDS